MDICCQHFENIYVSRIYTLLQGPTVQGPNCPLFQGGQLGPGQLGPGARLSGAQYPALKKVASWAPRQFGPGAMYKFY